MKTKSIFIVSSGRSGTQMMEKLLKGIPTLEIHHEYLCTHVQPLAAIYYMKLIDKETVKKELKAIYGSAIYYCQKPYWCDSSNKVSWLIEPLFELFPDSKFVHLVRDGRKVVSSYLHKLGDEIYDDESVKIMQDWLLNHHSLPKPPPEKKYWWNIPQKGQPFAEEFPKFNQFQRICYHWVEVNRVIFKSLAKIPKNQKLFCKLENLTTRKDVLKNFLNFFEVEYNESFFEMLKRPHNVNVPKDFPLTDIQRKQFEEIAHDVMVKLGYDVTKEYRVKY